MPGDGPTGSRNRADIIRRATERWAAQLIDLSRMNNLLYFKDLTTGTLDLGTADGTSLDRLLNGDPVRASLLFPNDLGLQQARRRLTELRRRIRQYRDERGIEAGNLAFGMLSWRETQQSGTAADTNAPVLLRPLSITPRGTGGADFELTLSPDCELNPVLTYALGARSGLDIADIADDVASAPVPPDAESVVERLRERVAAAGVPVTFEDRMVAAAFAYEKMPMVRDLEESADLLASHPLVAAIAGDPAAKDAWKRRRPVAEVDPDSVAPEDEYLVLDADPSQQAAIHAALNGDDLVVQGPPGTGKSQMIANLLSAAAAAQMSVLFVAQKRAAIDAVVSNLRRCGLDEIVLDLHSPKTSRKAFVDQLRTSIERAEQTPAVDVAELARTLVSRREDLIERSTTLTDERSPSGRSILDMEQLLLGLGPEPGSGVRLSRTTLNQLSWTGLQALGDELAQFVEADGLRFWRGESPWSRADGVSDQDRVRTVQDRLDRLDGQDRAALRRDLGTLLRQVGLPEPRRLTDWGRALGLLDGVTESTRLHGNQVFDGNLDAYRTAAATPSWRRTNGLHLGLLQRWRLRRAAMQRRISRTTRSELFDELDRAVDLRGRWAALTGGRAPHPANGLAELRPLYERVRSDLEAVGACAVVRDIELLPDTEVDDVLRRMRDDEQTLTRLPWLNGQRFRFLRLGLTDLIGWVAAHDLAPEPARRALVHAWLDSNLRELQTAAPRYGRFSAATLTRVTEEFRAADQRHIAATASRVLRAVAEQQIAARDAHPDQRTAVLKQVSRKSRHKPIRELVDEAPDLLRKLRPCWVMSPLVVSQVLPPAQMFDLVVFDEASQIEPADAIPAIARARHVVVAGDHKQLPPTPFFRTSGGDNGDDEDDDPGAYESILDYVRPLLTPRMLTRHYRSRDDRLIAYSNREIYKNELRTFPGTSRAAPVRHEVVDATSRPGSGGYAPEEARRVVELAVEHAQDRPHQSLGIITLGTKGVDRIRSRLHEVLADRPDIAPFFDEDGGERPFFVKSIESVQGDERDVIILGIGGSRSAGGTLNHRFGAVNHSGGERRLNVAVTRARHSMIVVSMFRHHEIRDDDTKAGLTFLRGYLRFAGQPDSSGPGCEGGSVDPLEQRIRERLAAAGHASLARHGRSRTAVDIAVEHPDRPGELVLAIDTDRNGRHEPGTSVRERNRLRPEQLERMGWRYHYVTSTEWLRKPEEEWNRLAALLEDARLADTAEDGAGRFSDVDEPPAEPEPPVRTHPKPFIGPPMPIDQRSPHMLDELVRWIDSDRLLRDEHTTIGLMMTELGYRNRGRKIVAALSAAIRRVHG